MQSKCSDRCHVDGRTVIDNNLLAKSQVKKCARMLLQRKSPSPVAPTTRRCKGSSYALVTIIHFLQHKTRQCPHFERSVSVHSQRKHIWQTPYLDGFGSSSIYSGTSHPERFITWAMLKIAVLQFSSVGDGQTGTSTCEDTQNLFQWKRSQLSLAAQLVRCGQSGEYSW